MINTSPEGLCSYSEQGFRHASLAQERKLSSFVHPPLTHSANKRLLCVLDPEPVLLLMGVRVSAFVSRERHIHKSISKGHGSRHVVLDKVARVVV